MKRAITGQSMDDWNDKWLTSANVRAGDIIALPEEWTADQVRGFQDWWDASLSNPAARQRTMFLPSGSSKISDGTRKDQDFQAFELQLIRRLCALFGVQPASIGYVGEQYKVSQEGSMDASRRVGLGRLLALRKEFYDDLAVRLGCPDVEMRNVDDDLGEREQLSRIGVAECGGPFKTTNEVRAEHGLDPLDGGDEIPGQQAEEAEVWDDESDADNDPNGDQVDRAYNPHQPRDAKG